MSETNTKPKVIHQIFERTETKYLLTSEQRNLLFRLIGNYFTVDQFGRSTICNLYFDTNDYRLIRDSMEKPIYKEKLRLRSYGIPENDSTVFLELKKKYKGIVYKRREKMTLQQANTYIHDKILPFDTQIMKEIDWMVRHYGSIKPAVYISYQRDAFYCTEDPNLRITFDNELLFRTEHVALEDGVYGQSILEKDKYIMEIKALNSMPLWLTGALDELKIFPASFSKYGTAYQKYIFGG